MADAVSLVAVAHGEAVRLISSQAGQDFSGLTVAVRRRRRRNVHLGRRLLQLDQAINFLRHGNGPKVDNMRAALSLELDVSLDGVGRDDPAEQLDGISNDCIEVVNGIESGGAGGSLMTDGRARQELLLRDAAMCEEGTDCGEPLGGANGSLLPYGRVRQELPLRDAAACGARPDRGDRLGSADGSLLPGGRVRQEFFLREAAVSDEKADCGERLGGADGSLLPGGLVRPELLRDAAVCDERTYCGERLGGADGSLLPDGRVRRELLLRDAAVCDGMQFYIGESQADACVQTPLTIPGGFHMFPVWLQESGLQACARLDEAPSVDSSCVRDCFRVRCAFLDFYRALCKAAYHGDGEFEHFGAYDWQLYNKYGWGIAEELIREHGDLVELRFRGRRRAGSDGPRVVWSP